MGVVHCEKSISCELHELPEMSSLEVLHRLGWRRNAIVKEVAMGGVFGEVLASVTYVVSPLSGPHVTAETSDVSFSMYNAHADRKIGSSIRVAVSTAKSFSLLGTGLFK